MGARYKMKRCQGTDKQNDDMGYEFMCVCVCKGRCIFDVRVA